MLEIRYDDLVGTYEQKRAVVSQLNLMDDIFFSVVMEDKEACEYLLSGLLGKKIKVINNKTQYSLRNIENHSVDLDALVEDEEHKLYNVEVQIKDKDDLGRRMRYYQSALDWSFLEKGGDYKLLPETYLIFITKFDPFKKNKNYYEIKQYIGDTTEKYSDGIHRLYFNTAVDDGTCLSELLQYMKDSKAENNNFGALSKAVNFRKVQSEEVTTMCEALEKLVETQKNEGRIEGRIESVKNMLEDNMPLEKALKYAKLDIETYEKYSKRVP